MSPSKSKGQNFLLDENLAEAIAHEGGIEPGDVVLEIGPGFGMLTRRLLAHEPRVVVAVEKDPPLVGALGRLFPAELAAGRLEVLEADALATKNALAPALLERLGEVLDDSPLKVVANLPYAVATPLVVGLLSQPLPLETMAVMVQLEAAERFVADRGEEGYGAVSLLLAALCTERQIVRKVPREVFHPRPRVHSAVVRFTPRPRRWEGFARLSQVVRGLFNFRRKTLSKAATVAAKREPALAGLPAALAEAGLDPQRRPEALSLEDFESLARGLGEGSVAADG